MPVSKEIDISGFDELQKTLDALAEEIGKAKTAKIWQSALANAFEPVLQQAKSNALAHKRTGQLADHIYMKAQRPTGRDKSSRSYRGEVMMVRITSSAKRDESTAKVYINKKGKETTVYNNRPVGVAAEFGNAHSAPFPFLRSALEAHSQNVQKRLGYALWTEIQWGKYTKGKV